MPIPRIHTKLYGIPESLLLLLSESLLSAFFAFFVVASESLSLESLLLSLELELLGFLTFEGDFVFFTTFFLAGADDEELLESESESESEPPVVNVRLDERAGEDAFCGTAGFAGLAGFGASSNAGSDEYVRNVVTRT